MWQTILYGPIYLLILKIISFIFGCASLCRCLDFSPVVASGGCSLVVASGGCSLVVAQGLLIAVVSLAAEHGLRACGLR